MTNYSTLVRTTAISALTLVALYAQTAEARSVSERFDVKSGQSLDLRTESGSIEIKTHNDDEVLVEVDIDGDDEDKFDLTFDKTSNGLRIIGERDHYNGWGGWMNMRVRFTITVPKEFDLELQTSGGRIEIDDLIGDIDANTSGGSIEVSNVEGDIELQTSGGSITTKRIMGEIDAHTSGGSINVEFARQPKEDASLTTSGGSITAILPEDVRLNIDASTSGGRVHSEFDVDGKIKKRSIRGEINGGGPTLDLHTSGGSIRIKRD